MAQSVELSDEVMTLVHDEAKLRNRSVGEQIARWLLIGRATELSGAFEHCGGNRPALESGLYIPQLPQGEQVAWLEAFTGQMKSPTVDERNFFREREWAGDGVGIDSDGDLIYARDGIARKT